MTALVMVGLALGCLMTFGFGVFAIGAIRGLWPWNWKTADKHGKKKKDDDLQEPSAEKAEKAAKTMKHPPLSANITNNNSADLSTLWLLSDKQILPDDEVNALETTIKQLITDRKQLIVEHLAKNSGVDILRLQAELKCCSQDIYDKHLALVIDSPDFDPGDVEVPIEEVQKTPCETTEGFVSAGPELIVAAKDGSSLVEEIAGDHVADNVSSPTQLTDAAAVIEAVSSPSQAASQANSQESCGDYGVADGELSHVVTEINSNADCGTEIMADIKVITQITPPPPPAADEPGSFIPAHDADQSSDTTNDEIMKEATLPVAFSDSDKLLLKQISYVLPKIAEEVELKKFEEDELAIAADLDLDQDEGLGADSPLSCSPLSSLSSSLRSKTLGLETVVEDETEDADDATSEVNTSHAKLSDSKCSILSVMSLPSGSFDESFSADEHSGRRRGMSVDRKKSPSVRVNRSSSLRFQHTQQQQQQQQPGDQPTTPQSVRATSRRQTSNGTVVSPLAAIPSRKDLASKPSSASVNKTHPTASGSTTFFLSTKKPQPSSLNTRAQVTKPSSS